MPHTAGSRHRDVPVLRPLSDAHTLLVADTEHDSRRRAADWVGEQLVSGAKVYYKGRLEDGQRADQHWLARARSSRLGPALASGQLEFCDFATVIERCGGTTRGLRELQADEADRALGPEGWSRVAMSQESARRPMVDEAEAAEYAAQEAGYDDLAARLPVQVLCQLSTVEESRAAIWETAALHHDRIVDRQWSARGGDGCWRLRGELDAHAVPRFGAALYGALRARRDDADGPDLDVDLSGVTFLDFACAQSLTLTARAAGRHQGLVLHGTSAFARRIIEVAGRPSTLRFA